MGILPPSTHRVFKTTDAGTTWTRVAKPGNQQPVEMHFNDATHGWIVAAAV
jgi:hypothetical protein